VLRKSVPAKGPIGVGLADTSPATLDEVRKPDPERIFIARRIAHRNRLLGEGVSEEMAG
jgi:hypothetical protein